MSEPDFAGVLGPALAGALERRGFTELTSVQKTVLDPELAGRDLRITSQTGSGKTVAIGFVLRELAADRSPAESGVARPRAIVIAPTRELAKQVEEELSWLYAPLGARVASATGGASLRDERRALASGPVVVVGTPGRLLDHLNRGAIDASQLGAVVLDEADRLLDMGFREELEAILAFAPEGHRTHLVSATFPRDVRALADEVQNDAAHVEGTRLGQANVDIDHVLHLVDARDRLGAVVNLLLAHPDEQMLVFARTRADVGDIADALVAAGFAASSLSGEMEQPARDRALAAFKRGDLRVLVATDVAARGIDVQDIARVLHADPPGDADTYTHRSGRTGRAGRKGVSSVLVPPSVLGRVVRLLDRAKVTYRFEKIPSAAEIRKASEERLFAALVSDGAGGGDGAGEGGAGEGGAPGAASATGAAGVAGAAGAADAAGEGSAPVPDERALSLAARLAEAGNVARTIARLLMRARQATGPEPRDIRMIEPPSSVVKPSRRSAERPGRAFERRRPAFEGDRAHAGADRPAYGSDRPPHGSDRPPFGAERPPRSERPPRDLSRAWTPFQVSWGEVHGADSRRMLAMLCRRGGIGSEDVGSIKIGHVSSTVEISADVADRFAEAAGKTDLRDPRIVIRPFTAERPARPRPRTPGAFATERPAPRHAAERHPSERPPPRHPSERPPPRPAAERHAAERHPSERPPPRHATERPTAHRPTNGKSATAKERPAAKKPWAKKKPADRTARGGDTPPKRHRAG